MPVSTLATILVTTLFAFATLYVPQPILPLIAADLGVSATDAALLITAVMVPLGVAPLVYGYLTEALSAKRVLRVALALLVVNQALFAVFDQYWVLVGLRFAQGLLLPAIFTALVTYCAVTANAEGVRGAVGFYIASTIMGGFAGRLIGGLAGEYLNWRYGFVILAVILVPAWLYSARLPSDARSGERSVDLAAAVRVLSWPGYALGFCGLALVFFVYAAVLTYMPFRLKALDPEISELAVSLVYLGYLSGAVMALRAPQIAAFMGGDLRGIMVGALVCLISLLGMLIPAITSMFCFMLTLSAGFFLVHAMLSAFLNYAARDSRGVVNGLYISFYYSGGALGAYLPGFILRGFDWTVFVLFLVVVFVTGVAAFTALRRIAHD